MPTEPWIDIIAYEEVEPFVAALDDPEEAVRIAVLRLLLTLRKYLDSRTMEEVRRHVDHKLLLRPELEFITYLPTGEECVRLLKDLRWSTRVVKRYRFPKPWRRSFKYLTPGAGGHLVTLHFAAVATNRRPYRHPAHLKEGVGDCIAREVAGLGNNFKPDITALFQIYLALMQRASDEKKEWLAYFQEAERLDVTRQWPPWVRWGYLTISWQIAWTASRASVPAVVRAIGPAMLEGSSGLRWAAAQFIEEAARWAPMSVQFGGLDGPENIDAASAVQAIREGMPAEYVNFNIDSVSAIAEVAERVEPTGAALSEPVAAPAETAQAASLPVVVPAAIRESGTSKPVATDAEAVDSAVFSPPHVARDSVFLVQVFLYPPRAATQVDMQARQADETAQRRGTYSLPLDLPLGTRIDLHLEFPGLIVPEPDAMLVWRGSPTAAQFEVAVPANAAGVQVIGRVRIAVAGVPAGTLRFQVTLTAVGTSPGAVDARELKARRYRRAFVSYSSQDRAEVLRRVQAFRIAGLSVFQDILDLDPGERWQKALYHEIDNCDLFLLFWSHAAAASEWVGKEIEYALARKGGDEEQPPDIQPVPIEGPPIVPPPVSLHHLHFNDALLAQIHAAEKTQYDRTATHDLKN